MGIGVVGRVMGRVVLSLCTHVRYRVRDVWVLIRCMGRDSMDGLFRVVGSGVIRVLLSIRRQGTPMHNCKELGHLG